MQAAPGTADLTVTGWRPGRQVRAGGRSSNASFCVVPSRQARRRRIYQGFHLYRGSTPSPLLHLLRLPPLCRQARAVLLTPSDSFWNFWAVKQSSTALSESSFCSESGKAVHVPINHAATASLGTAGHCAVTSSSRRVLVERQIHSFGDVACSTGWNLPLPSEFRMSRCRARGSGVEMTHEFPS